MSTAHSVHCNKLRIAIIDEDSTIRLDLCSLLEAQGHQAKHFHSSDGFLDAAKRDDFDCILLELWFKNGMNGLDMLRHLAEFGRLKPTVMMSALLDVDSALEAGKSGFSAFLAKPLRGMQVWNAVQQAITAVGATRCAPKKSHTHLTDLMYCPETLSETRWSCLLCRAENRINADLFRRLESLTRTEAKVFFLLALQGLPTKSIAAKLNIGTRTAETHRGNVFGKLGMRSPVQLREVLDEVLKVAA
jgi:FixJ family two-component response regulator